MNEAINSSCACIHLPAPPLCRGGGLPWRGRGGTLVDPGTPDQAKAGCYPEEAGRVRQQEGRGALDTEVLAFTWLVYQGIFLLWDNKSILP